VLEDVDPEITADDGYLYSFAPLRARIDADITDARAATLFQSSAAFFAATTCLESGKVTFFQAGGPDATSATKGAPPVRLTAREALVTAMFASASQPVLFQSVPITVGGKPLTFVDGGVLDYAPLDIAIANGATDIYLAMLSPDPSQPTANWTASATGLPKLADTLLRTLDLLSGKTGEDSLALAKLYAQGTERLAAIRARATAAGIAADVMAKVFDPTTPAEQSNPFSSGADVTIWVIRPTKDFEVDGLTFDPNWMKQWLGEGYARAEAVVTAGQAMRLPLATA
jgi:hypothetical protein